MFKNRNKETNLREKDMTNSVKEVLGNEFSSKLKSIKRNSYRDYRKEMGPGSASLRRFISSKIKNDK